MGTVLSQKVTVRRALAADGEAVWPLAESGLAPHPARREAFDPDFAAMVANDGRGVLVAELDGKVIGYVSIHRHTTLRDHAPVAWVEGLVVAEAHRGAGVGRVLMEVSEEWARRADCAHMAVAARGADGFFEALGFCRTAGLHEKLLV